jgi:hypothetical protein
MGMLEKDSENIASFRLVTTSSESFLVTLSKEQGSKDFFSMTGYGEYFSNYSEESMMGWIEFFDDYAELESLKEKEGMVGARKDVSFMVNVPEDAEPGYHVFRVKPTPVLSHEDLGQVGTKVVAITSVNFLLNVEGDAIRDGIILDVVSAGVHGGGWRTNTYFQNTGTVTMTARAIQTMYRDGEVVATSESAKELIGPDSMKSLSVPFSSSEITPGDYEVRTTVNFLTGSVSKNSTLTILEPAVPPVKPEEKPKPFPWFIIILILIVVIAVLIYKW